MADDPDAVCAVIHALNEWMHEHWSYVYSDAHLLDADHQPRRRHRRARIEELECVARARRQDLPHPRRAGAHVEGPQVVRAAGVRPVLGAGAGARPRRRHALGRLRLHPLHQRVGGPRRPGDGASPVEGSPALDPAFLALSSEKDNLVDAMASIIGHGLATRFPKLQVHAGRVRAASWIRPVLREAAARLRRGAGAVRREPGRRVQPATCGCTPSTSPTPRASSTSASPSTTSCSAPTSRTPRAWPTRSPTREVVKDLPLEQQALIMGGVAREGDEGRAVRLTGETSPDEPTTTDSSTPPRRTTSSRARRPPSTSTACR